MKLQKKYQISVVHIAVVMLGENSYLELTRNYEDDLTLVLRGLKLRGKAQVYLNINKNFGFS